VPIYSPLLSDESRYVAHGPYGRVIYVRHAALVVLIGTATSVASAGHSAPGYLVQHTSPLQPPYMGFCFSYRKGIGLLLKANAPETPFISLRF
jgi:hypothetical protein